jgi:hypothetical protein
VLVHLMLGGAGRRRSASPASRQMFGRRPHLLTPVLRPSLLAYRAY